MSDFLHILQFTFVQHALLAGVCIGVLAGLLGPFLVQSRNAIASDMFAHVALAGIGGAVLLGVTPWWGALPVLLLFSTLLWWLSRQNWYSPDALAMFFLSGGLALALAFIHVARNQTFSFEQYLFGSILTVSSVELWSMGALLLLVGGLVTWLWYPLLGATQSPSYRIPFSARPQLVQLVFWWLVSVVVWVGIKTVGGLLVGALLVIPALVVRPRVTSFRALTLGTVGVATVAAVVGVLLSVLIDLPPSSLIIFLLIGLFILERGLAALGWRGGH